MIDRNSPVPFYFQLAEIVEEEIASGRWAPGTRLPSEPNLCEQYALSRTTIRQALARLEEKGLIERNKGRGTFVASSKPRSWHIQTTEGFFHGDFVRAGHRVSSRVLRIERAPLTRWASDALELPPDSLGVTVERIRLVDNLVALYVVNSLPESVAEAILGLGPDESLYQRLAEKAGINVFGGRRTLEAVIAGARLAELLEVEPTQALAYIESVSREAGGTCVDCYRAWLRTDRMRIDITVSSRHSDGVQLPDLVATSSM
jgi:GntR family transcriptional regulator